MDLNFNLTNDQKKQISELFKKMMVKYQQYKTDDEYFNGLIDGINHCNKVINGVEDDYLDRIY